MSTIKEIAEKTNLSVGTVSLVLNGRGDEMRISKKTQERVIEAAKGYGYLPNVAARRLRQSGNKNIPIIAAFWPNDLSADMLGRFFMGAQGVMMQEENEFEMTIHPYRRSQIHKMRSRCDTGLFNGVILTGISQEDQDYLEQNPLGLPTVIFNRESSVYANVHVDNFEIGRKTAELFAIRGHKHVGIIMPDYMEKTKNSQRQTGFIESCPRYGLTLSEAHIQSAPMTMEGGNDAALRMLAGEGEPPTAVFFPISLMAVAALSVFHGAGIKIPDQMEIMTYGDHEIERYTVPSLSTMKLPVEEMARVSINLILEAIRGTTDHNSSVVFETPFIFRQSCGGYTNEL
ncbi:LacI family DNA-binding transcriptional regulator [Paenibacillus sp. sgz5001063]|uniref:LacI family DNA-binding transcriptional regulator n=1 Tax=Paenibacillus sp. sgz5001063 TaxID=3242474 RepID=UPI0036D3DFFF